MKGSYRFIELEEHEDPFEVTDIHEFVGVGIASWNGQNKAQILAHLSEVSVWQATFIETYLTLDQIPHESDKWKMEYGDSVEVFRKIEALGAVGKRFGTQDASSQALYRSRQLNKSGS